MPLDTLVAEGATSLYDGIAATMMRATAPGRRQLIVAFTDGRDSTSIIDEKTVRRDRPPDRRRRRHRRPRRRGPRRRSARRLAQRERPSIRWLTGENVDIGGRGATGRAAMGRPARPGGARRHRPSGQVFPLGTDDSVSQVFKAMLDDFRASYVLQYVPRGVPADGWHEVSVDGEEARRNTRFARGRATRGGVRSPLSEVRQ